MKRVIPLLIIGLFAAYLRFDRLTSIPPSLSHDEVAIGYNAYSILKTGKDEYGAPFPLLFRSFDDYKLPGMVYATVPSVALFGLNELGVRFPSAFFGTLAVLVLYGIARELTNKQTIRAGSFALDVSFIVSLMFAISAWHINFSRQSFESNGSLFFFMLGTYFLLCSKRNIHYLLFALLSYVTSLYFYYSVRLVIPFVLLGYLWIYREYLVKNLRWVLIASFVSCIVFLPMLKSMLTAGGFERIKIVSVINDSSFAERKSEFVARYAARPTLINKILFNQRTALMVTIADNYRKNLTPIHLLTTGTGTYGLLHGTEFPFFFLGIPLLFLLARPEKWLVIIWGFTAFLPGALSVDQPNALRTLTASPIFSLLSGLGITACIRWVSEKKRLFLVSLLIIALFYTLRQFSYAYFSVNTTKNALGFGDGHKQMVNYVASQEKNYDAVIISGYYWRPYIYMLFGGKYDPILYQTSGSRDHFGKYYFTAAEWDTSGTSMYDENFNPKTFPQNVTGHKLFILAAPEYDRHRNEFQPIASIDGKIVHGVFVAATLR